MTCAVAIAGLDALAKGPSGAGGQAYAISGDVDGVIPGLASTLAARMENPNRFVLEVRTLDITVGDAAAGCASTNLVVGVAVLPVTIPARGSTSVSVPVRFADDPADACQGAEFPIAYHGTAVRADPAPASPSPSPTPSPTTTPKPKPTPRPR